MALFPAMRTPDDPEHEFATDRAEYHIDTDIT